jgi:hypothetical protein
MMGILYANREVQGSPARCAAMLHHLVHHDMAFRSGRLADMLHS